MVVVVVQMLLTGTTIEEEEVKEKTVEKENLLTSLSFAAKQATKKGARWTTRLEVTTIVDENGALEISAVEVGVSGASPRRIEARRAPLHCRRSAPPPGAPLRLRSPPACPSRTTAGSSAWPSSTA